MVDANFLTLEKPCRGAPFNLGLLRLDAGGPGCDGLASRAAAPIPRSEEIGSLERKVHCSGERSGLRQADLQDMFSHVSPGSAVGLDGEFFAPVDKLESEVVKV